MHRFARFIFQFLLRHFSRAVLRKYRPRVIAITGSVGKSSCKEAIYAVLAPHFRCAKSPASYNNQFGVPLAILGLSSPGSSIGGWLWVLVRGIWLLVYADQCYPEVLVLEFGADRPGDIDYLVRLARPEIGVVTRVAEVHLQSFQRLDRIVKEKRTLVEGLPSTGFAILNVDDENVQPMAERTSAHVMTYGFSASADVAASEATLQEITVEGRWGMNWKMTYHGSTVPVFLPGVMGKQQVYAALAASAVGVVMQLNLVEITEGLRKYTPPPGRMRLLPGVKNTQIIDDTYNASPTSTLAALQVLSEVAAPRKIAVLADMLELGIKAEVGHEEVGRFVGGVADLLITVGDLGRTIAASAKAAGLDTDHVFTFSTADEARKFVQEQLHPGDLVLVKGSRRMHMERVVKEIMDEPLRAKELLVWDNQV